ncbi:unnamed protein product, partial [Angiostrongylus costaricensis]|uniref:Myrosinase 1 n=1 Tax=Angiostrongylus costaricensis TaxID=334426 RepID=A0A0R3PKQ7_ANGCS
RPEYHNFPSGFKWSVATSAFQIEGASKEDGRGPTIWDEYQKKPGKIIDNSTADISSDSYHKFREDIKLLKSLGVSHYRFSLSWSRMFPTGVTTNPNLKGIQHYHAVIDTLIENNIEPMVTLYHWDLPLALHDAGGWLNKEIVKWFRLYAVFCFREYGNKVSFQLHCCYFKVFITENGCMDTPGESLNDVTRMRYLREHIAAVSQAIVDGCNVVGYTLWSLIDNFEWTAGYTKLFGIHEVDFTSHSRTRTPKHSAKLYADIIRKNSVVLVEGTSTKICVL